ncbi:MAG: serine hydrolase [Saprospiraceae bacterium]
MRQRVFLSLFLVLFLSPLAAQRKLLLKLMKSHPEQFGVVLQHPEQYDVQVIYTQIDRDRDNFPHFKSYTYQLDASHYFYPASTVKMPTAFMALEKINRLHIPGLDRYSTMKTGAGHPPQTAAAADTTSPTGLPSVGHYVKKIFLVSDNDAFNRLYEFIGQQQLNEGLWAKGYDHVRIVHRLESSGFDAEANRYTNPVSFYSGDSLLYHQAEVYGRAEKHFDLRKVKRGKGFYKNGVLVNEPFDFSEKNYISLQDLHDILKAVLFPGAVPSARRFDLAKEDYRFLYRVMSERPRESHFPDYSDKPDHYAKFFIYGDEDDGERMPENVRIFNKPGEAYGFLTDVAYVVDFEAGVEFMLAATIHVNKDGIYNDDNYEYESVGLPFLANLGRVVYDFEKRRKRKYRPDLSRFLIEDYN